MPRSRDYDPGPPAALSNLRPGEGLSHHCNKRGCYYRVDLSIDALTDEFGPDILIIDLHKHLPCPRCGGSDTTVIRQADAPTARAAFRGE